MFFFSKGKVLKENVLGVINSISFPIYLQRAYTGCSCANYLPISLIVNAKSCLSLIMNATVCCTWHFCCIPVLVLNEVDKLSREAQHSLRRTMEKYSSSCRLILCCNSSSKVTEAIRSRCLNVRVNAPAEDQVRGSCLLKFLKLFTLFCSRLLFIIWFGEFEPFFTLLHGILC